MSNCKKSREQTMKNSLSHEELHQMLSLLEALSFLFGTSL
jgi:hypothetical protein